MAYYSSLFKKDDVRITKKVEWRKVKGFEYEVSNYGDVKSLPKEHKQVYNTGKVGLHKTKERILSRRYDNKGYSTCILYKGGKTYCKKVHRLVAECFIPNPLNYDQINHKNGIKDDNRVSNLEWCNNSYNQKHAIRIGLKKNIINGEDNNMHKLTSENVRRIIMAKTLGIKTGELVKMFNVNRHTIRDIFSGRTWKHIKLNIVANG